MVKEHFEEKMFVKVQSLSPFQNGGKHLPQGVRDLSY